MQGQLIRAEKKNPGFRQAVNVAVAQRKRMEKGRWDGGILFEIKQSDSHMAKGIV